MQRLASTIPAALLLLVVLLVAGLAVDVLVDAAAGFEIPEELRS